MTYIEIYNKLKNGGRWLSAARTWMQSNVPRGDTLTWGDGTQVSIPFCKLEDLAFNAALNAVLEYQDNLELVGYMQRYLDPEEGPSIWIFCSISDAEIFKSKNNYQLKPVFSQKD